MRPRQSEFEFIPRLPYVVALLLGAILTTSIHAPARSVAAIPIARRLSPLRPMPARNALPVALPEQSARAACIPPVQLPRLRGVIDRAVLKAAPNQLDLPLGGGRLVTLHGKRFLFCLEPHFHEPGSGEGPDGWHKGVTVYDAS